MIAAGVGGVAWTLGPAGSGDAATGAAGTDPSPPTELARPSPEEPPPGAASESGQAAPEPSSVSGFGGLAESLRAAIERYRQRHGDFERGRIGCDLLAAGYARVSDAVVELARVPASRERIPVTGGEDPFLSLMQEAAETDRLFEASGCPRP